MGHHNMKVMEMRTKNGKALASILGEHDQSLTTKLSQNAYPKTRNPRRRINSPSGEVTIVQANQRGGVITPDTPATGWEEKDTRSCPIGLPAWAS